MKTMKRIFTAVLLMTAMMSLNAQQVNTLYYLENAPMRHTINPAFQPVSRGYINFTPLGWTSMGIGNNSLTLSDLLYVDPTTGKTITPLHPNGDKQALLNVLRKSTLFNGEMTLGLLNMGFAIKENGYLTIGINEKIDAGMALPKPMFDFLLGGGMQDLEGGWNTFNLSQLGVTASAYTEVGFGYSHRINDHWTVGGKLKLLLGQLYAGINANDLRIDASLDEWKLQGDLDVMAAGPINYDLLPKANNMPVKDYYDQLVNGEDGSERDWSQIVDYKDWRNLAKPSGYGAALDLGVAWKPIQQLQISAAVTDLGFIYWNRSRKYNAHIDTTFTGVGDFEYNDPAFQNEQGDFDPQLLLDSALNSLKGIANSARLNGGDVVGAKMVTARLNVGLDANFWDNRIGLGVMSATKFRNSRVYEEVTFGLAFRPVNWFNLAATYSLLDNGKYSNIGAGLGFMPYDGINLTLAMDYIPTSYAATNVNEKPMYVIPDKTKMFNIAMGFSICWGSNRRDKDHDGVWDKLDMCPNTPRGVAVDENGCPLDEDKDGVPDYLDKCLGTPAEAIGMVDSVGCPKDSDGDGVADYLDKCPNTPKEAIGKVDSVGCELDSDGDGVPDWKDECENTPKEAIGFVDEKGCEKDSDGDGVVDWKDKCADTPAGAPVDENGCELDSDGDGVPDWKDECKNTPKEAIGFVDDKGCELDSDGDGIVDWKDKCPNTPAGVPVDANGCEKDSDGDGVPDWRDECENTPKKAQGMVDEKGCPLDSDGDEVPDYLDECPTVPGLKVNKGCPEIKREIRQLLKKAMQGIEFETGKSTILPVSYPILDQIAQHFIENPTFVIEVQGHTDNVGKADMNKRLSQARADAVREYLIGKGVPAERMTAVGYGPERPIADNKSKAGRAKNRRVEFDITFEQVTYETILDHADPAEETTEE